MFAERNEMAEAHDMSRSNAWVCGIAYMVAAMVCAVAWASAGRAINIATSSQSTRAAKATFAQLVSPAMHSDQCA